MAFDIVELTGWLGAEIKGLDLGEPLDDGTVTALRAAWLRHHVLLFRDLDMSEADQIRFAGYFGRATETQRSKNKERRPDADPRLMLVSNIRENGELIGTLPGGRTAVPFRLGVHRAAAHGDGALRRDSDQHGRQHLFRQHARGLGCATS